MSVRCLITEGKNYEQNKQFVEDTLKYFPDYDFNIMKATISGWQSSQLKDNEDRLPTIQELIDYLQNSAKRENNNNIKIIADKAQQILNNLSTYDKELFLFTQSVKSIADRLEHDSKEYGVVFTKCYVEELRSKAENLLERIQE